MGMPPFLRFDRGTVYLIRYADPPEKSRDQALPEEDGERIFPGHHGPSLLKEIQEISGSSLFMRIHRTRGG
jgi:hypothetical protein